MTADQDHVIHACLAALGVSQVELARLLGVAPQTLRQWLTAGTSRRAMPGPAYRLCVVLASDPTRVRATLAAIPGLTAGLTVPILRSRR